MLTLQYLCDIEHHAAILKYIAYLKILVWDNYLEIEHQATVFEYILRNPTFLNFKQ